MARQELDIFSLLLLAKNLFRSNPEVCIEHLLYSTEQSHAGEERPLHKARVQDPVHLSSALVGKMRFTNNSKECFFYWTPTQNPSPPTQQTLSGTSEKAEMENHERTMLWGGLPCLITGGREGGAEIKLKQDTRTASLCLATSGLALSKFWQQKN